MVIILVVKYVTQQPLTPLRLRRDALTNHSYDKATVPCRYLKRNVRPEVMTTWPAESDVCFLWKLALTLYACVMRYVSHNENDARGVFATQKRYTFNGRHNAHGVLSKVFFHSWSCWHENESWHASGSEARDTRSMTSSHQPRLQINSKEPKEPWTQRSTTLLLGYRNVEFVHIEPLSESNNEYENLRACLDFL